MRDLRSPGAVSQGSADQKRPFCATCPYRTSRSQGAHSRQGSVSGDFVLRVTLRQRRCRAARPSCTGATLRPSAAVGGKIFAEEVEHALLGHPDVHDVLVRGRPSELWGEEVVAIVALRDGPGARRGSARHRWPPRGALQAPGGGGPPGSDRSAALGEARLAWARQGATAPEPAAAKGLRR
ncbi:MAG: AMP-binding enzyme [Micromonosporaceae bacterium]